MASKKRTLTKPSYENRLVLFIDFLGFKNLIARTSGDEQLLEKIVSAMDHIKQIADESEFFDTQRVTQFSDCMVVSYRVDEKSAVFDLITNIGFMLVDLAGRGFLLRGAVTVGQLFHTAEHVLGPAMVRAYELESKCAKYPRVVVDRAALNVPLTAPASHHSGQEELGYVSGYLQQDEDGQLFIDYISWNAVVGTIGGDEKRYPEYLQDIGNLVKEGLKYDSASVLEKMLWLHGHYSRAVRLIKGLPKRNKWRTQNPLQHISISALPMFIKEVRAARKIIASPIARKVR